MKVKYLLLSFLLASCSSNQLQHEDWSQRDPASFQSCFQMMQSFFPEPKNGFAQPNFKNSKSLDELENWYDNNSLINIQKSLSQSDIVENNKIIGELFSKPLKLNNTNEQTTFITKAEADLILKEVTNSRPNKNHMCYDPQLTVGFCFGRATMGHMEALVRGVHPEAIRKIWIAGDMKEWGHHVAVIIKAEDGWWVIDTNLNRVVKTDEWIKYYQPMKASKAKDIMVFATRADRFGPYDSSSYTGINLFNTNNDIFNRDYDYYKGYFHDYFEDLDNNLGKIKKFPVR